MVNQKIQIAKIDATNRLRDIDPAHAEVIAASIDEVGMKQPISVRLHPNRDEEGCAYEYKLVIGGHRLYAVDLLLGWNELKVGSQVLIEDLDDDAARLAEVDENLARHELNALDRSLFLAERKRLYVALHPAAAAGGDRKSRKIMEKIKDQSLVFDRSFASATAKRVGLSKSTINLSIGIAEKLDRETIDALRGTSVETNQKELLALAAITDLDERHLIVGAIREGKAKSTLKAKYAVGLEKEPRRDPQDAYLAAANYAVSKMDARTLKAFLATPGWTHADGASSTPAKPRGGK